MVNKLISKDIKSSIFSGCLNVVVFAQTMLSVSIVETKISQFHLLKHISRCHLYLYINQFRVKGQHLIPGLEIAHILNLFLKQSVVSRPSQFVWILLLKDLFACQRQFCLKIKYSKFLPVHQCIRQLLYSHLLIHAATQRHNDKDARRNEAGRLL